MLAERFEKVIALDLTKPTISHPKILCVQGDAARLAFLDDSIDFVFCAEVLEHIPRNILGKVCNELERVCRDTLLVGVPYKQDIRVGRTTCYTCMEKNPPWGHVNSFDEIRLGKLFAKCSIGATSFVGKNTERTNALSCYLMDLAGNPYGTYSQEESCIYCGHPLLPPPVRTLTQKGMTKLAFWARAASAVSVRPRPNWMHMRLSKDSQSKTRDNFHGVT